MASQIHMIMMELRIWTKRVIGFGIIGCWKNSKVPNLRSLNCKINQWYFGHNGKKEMEENE